MSKLVVYENFEIELKNEGYYEVRLSDDCDFTKEELLLLIQAQEKWGGERLPALVMCGEYTSTDIEFLKYLGINKNNPYSKADAFVLKSVAQRLLASFYSKAIQPERPTRFFNRREDAMKWLQQFID